MTIDYKQLKGQPMGIVFEQQRFSEPELLPESTGLGSFLESPGVYAILTDDPSSRPRPFRVLYFGEAENMQTRATAKHENFPAWQRETGLFGRLYRAFHAMPGSTQVQRQMVESALIQAYNPPCNKKMSFDFFGK